MRMRTTVRELLEAVFSIGQQQNNVSLHASDTLIK
jgi:hypothetical protein